MVNARNMVAACLIGALLMPCVEAAVRPEARPRIQVAVLLDTSNSMDGLIAQAKAQLWKIVNEFATTKKNGMVPDLEVALYEYGNNNIPAGEGHIRQVLPLTTDLDAVSEKLFALTTRGGHEFCGAVIKAAVEGLAWSTADGDLKTVFIAGNEPFTQGSTDYRSGCKAAVAKGITVNTIHCGSYDEGVRGKWKDGADLADGTYMHIDQNRAVAHVAAPQDKRIAQLGAELNKTYIAYGTRGAAGAMNQAEQDRNAAKLAGAGSHVQRAVAKASAQYRNAAWDLVDAVREGKVELEEIKEAELPETMRRMNAAERTAFVEAQAKRRAAIQAEIHKLEVARRAHVAAELKKHAKEGENTLDQAMIQALRKQAEKKNFRSE